MKCLKNFFFFFLMINTYFFSIIICYHTLIVPKLSFFPIQKDLVIYEMNVRAFTADESSGLDPNIRGSYLGVIAKVGKILKLNCV